MSPGTQKEVQEILRTCGKDANVCHEKVMSALFSADIETDNKLERRGIFNYVMRKFKLLGNRLGKVMGGPVLVIAGILESLAVLKSTTQPTAFHIPDPKIGLIDKAGSANGPVVVSALGRPVITVTLKSAPMATQG